MEDQVESRELPSMEVFNCPKKKKKVESRELLL